jgi:hypothetical protein
MDKIQRIIKYLIEGLAVAIVAKWFPTMKLSMQEIAMIALTASSTFAVMDTFAPSISDSVRQGTGLSIGAKLIF